MATWNAMWASGSTSRAVRVRRLRAVDADLLVVTEGQRDLLSDGGHVADAGTHGGYGITSHPRRRKTLLWSRWPLTEMAAPTTGAGAGRGSDRTDRDLGRCGEGRGGVYPVGECPCEHRAAGRDDLTPAEQAALPAEDALTCAVALELDLSPQEGNPQRQTSRGGAGAAQTEDSCPLGACGATAPHRIRHEQLPPRRG
ncbi:hypothetical protein M1M07_10565 [Rhodococcus sp. HM1]|uniref:hypothetical protein n=1 Tax=Rhodococcus sp. HM1 TaxID=2937759 RepID=UPI002009F6D0|nr:hypothetical protein [Rhodococcus sp. HM1]MCK8671560.1 hypothetical protein [Rhodococcus sp. HM1]